MGIGSAPREVDRYALLPGRLGQALGHALPVGLVGEFRADRGAVGLAGGLLARSSPGCALAHPGPPPAAPVAGGPHRGRVGVGLWAHAAPEEPRHLVRVTAVVLGRAPGNGLHGERRAPPEGQARSSAELRQPGPR
jgi:hypothetical protein